MSRTSAILLGLLGIVGLFFAMFALLIFFSVSSSGSEDSPRLSEKVREASASAELIEADIPPTKKPSEAPDWIDAAPRSVGDVYRMSIAVGPYTTRAECDAQLPSALQKALDRYVEAYLGEEVRRRIVLPADYLRQLVKDQWEEVREYSVGPMTTLHVLLEFDRQAKDRVLDKLRRTKVAGRLWFAGVGWVAWLVLLGGVYGYLRIAGSKKAAPGRQSPVNGYDKEKIRTPA